jgi:hypothetical protein
MVRADRIDARLKPARSPTQRFGCYSWKGKDDAVFALYEFRAGFRPVATLPFERYRRPRAEIAPAWVRTDLMNSREAKEPMPLDQFITETMDMLGTDADEIPGWTA